MSQEDLGEGHLRLSGRLDLGLRLEAVAGGAALVYHLWLLAARVCVCWRLRFYEQVVRYVWMLAAWSRGRGSADVSSGTWKSNLWYNICTCWSKS